MAIVDGLVCVRTEVFPKEGSFAIADGLTPDLSVWWYSCREQFASIFNRDTKSILFTHPAGQTVSLALFIEKIEEVLELSNDDLGYPPTVFQATNLNFASHITPSPFWTGCDLKRSLFTLFLRCGLKYNPDVDNFDKAIFTHEYVQATAPAVKRFLFGYTKCMTGVQAKGWVSTFQNCTSETARLLLVLPDHKEYEQLYIGENSLWV